MTLFEGQGLACVRGDRRVFAGLDFRLPPGGALLLAGPNGSGKSSLLRLMAGLLRPAAGSLLWDGRDAFEDLESHRGRLQYVGHLDAVKPVLSVEENLSFWARPAGHAGLGAALERLDLAWLAEVPGRLLSAGQRRRLALARLLVAPAELWLLDEPSVGLDEASVGRLRAVVSAHREAGGRVVAATHAPLDLPGAERLDLSAFSAPTPVELEPW